MTARLRSAADRAAFALAALALAAGAWRAMVGFSGLPGFRAAFHSGGLRALAASPGWWCYWALLCLVLAAGLGRLARWSAGPGQGMGAEALRLAALAVVAGWAARYLATSRFAGGLDARWYGYVFSDALAQARAGHWPVWVGQGPLQWNGAIHPLRTAPYLPNLGLLLDLLTLRQLTPFGVVHLALLVSLEQAALLCYLLLARVAPGARGLAWVAALAWSLAPLALGYAVGQEMFMTVAALAWLPLVYYANARLVGGDGRRPWILLAAGLALTWMSHAPVGAWAVAVTALVQGLRLLRPGAGAGAWRRALGGALLFGWLAAGYLYGMAELAPVRAHASAAAWAGLAAAVLAAAALVRLAAARRWLWVPLPAALLACLWRANAAAVPDQAAQAWAGLRGLVPGMFHPVSAHAALLSDLQLGAPLWTAALLGCLVAAFRRDLAPRLFAAALLALLPLAIPIPGVSRLWLAAVPAWVFGISSVSLWLRILPHLSLLAVFTFVLGVGPIWPRRGTARWPARLLLAGAAVALACWDRRELGKWRVRAAASVESQDSMIFFSRAEDAQLYSYSYDSLPRPSTMLNGVADYRLESRLLRARDLSVIPEPLLAAPAGRQIRLTGRPDPTWANWARLEPGLVLQPGERLILSFHFLERPYQGALVFRGPGGFFRSYYLPEAGFYAGSFGVAPGRPKALALWNDGPGPQPLELDFVEAGPQAMYGPFADVRVQAYRPEELRTDVLGLIPYRARVRSPEDAFLETPRVFIPGYRARVDGHPAPVLPSIDHLAMVRVGAGPHEVTMSYRPTFRFALALIVSGLGWAAAAFWLLRRPGRGSAPG